MNRRRNTQSGFTIVELLLAMAFVSFLLIIIALTVIQISNIYNKGLTMKAVDQAGRSISADIRLTLSQSQPFDVKAAFHLQSSNGGDTTNIGEAYGGRLCTGVFSYIWNFGQHVDAQINSYADGNDKIRLIRIRDNGAQYCSDLGRKVDTSNVADPREFLSGEDANLAIQSFRIAKLVDDVPIGQALYNVVFEVGTNDFSALSQDQHIDTIDTSCRPPSSDEALIDYCAVNQFDLTAQAGNKGGR